MADGEQLKSRPTYAMDRPSEPAEEKPDDFAVPEDDRVGTVTAFHPRNAKPRGKVFFGAFVAVLLSSCVFVVNLFFFWGATWDPTVYYPYIKIAVLDLDGGLVGQALAAALPKNPFAFNYNFVSNPTVLDLRASVERGDWQAALVALPNATVAWRAALTGADAAYNSQGALAFLFDEGRHPPSFAAQLRGMATAAAVSMSATLNGVAVTQVQAGVLSLSNTVPAAIALPVFAQENNIHRAFNLGLQQGISLGLIVTWTIQLLVTNVLIGVVENPSAKRVRKDQRLAFFGVAMIFAALWLSFWPPVIAVGLGRAWNGVGADVIDARRFFALWAWMWLVMLTFSSSVAWFLITLGPAFGNLLHMMFLILNLISSTAVLPMELMPAFFQIGNALPFQNAAVGSRYVIYGSYNRISQNTGVLFAWLGLSFISLCISIYMSHQRVVAQLAKDAAEEAAKRNGTSPI